MKITAFFSALSLLSMAALTSCHEGDPIPYHDDCLNDNFIADVTLSLDVDETLTDLYDIASRAATPVKRYTVWAMKSGSTEPAYIFVSYTPVFDVKMKTGEYEFAAFCDYVEQENQDRYYFTDKIEEILMYNKMDYDVATPHKHAFWGKTVSKVVYKNKPVGISLSSAMARIQYEATDSPADYEPTHIRVVYLETIPSAIDGRTSEICYNWADVAYKHELGDEYLSYDYIFADNSERSIPVMVEIFNADGKVKARSKRIEVPVRRGCTTTVSGPFFTTYEEDESSYQPSGGGLGLDTEFNTTITIEI